MFGNLTAIVNMLRAKNNEVKIFIAQIPPLGNKWDTASYCGSETLGQRLQNFNKSIPLFATKNSTSLSPIITVDQYTGVIPATDMYDDIHSNNKGENVMAERWFNAIKQYLKKL